MSANTAIEWTDHTFNPVWGCAAVSPACDRCYAEAWAKRFGVAWGSHGTFREFGDRHWGEPLKWNRQAQQAGRRRRVFCASMADVFDNRWPDGVRDRLWTLIRATPWLDWQLLTKRPQNIAKMLPADWGGGWPNVWLGTTVENQTEANRRIPHLLATPAAIRFLSCEPLLGSVDLSHVDLPGGWEELLPLGAAWLNRLEPGEAEDRRIDWVIAGGESGPRARPMHPDWARSLRDQCAKAGVPFFFKQWGEWADINQPGNDAICMHSRDRHFWPTGHGQAVRIGKLGAGNHLDGSQHLDFPTPNAAGAASPRQATPSAPGSAGEREWSVA